MGDERLREAVRRHVLRLAETDERVVAAAAVGSLAQGPGDRFSDLDLTFGVVPGDAVPAVLAAWTDDLAAAFGAAPLLDVVSGDALYRVFLLGGWLQVDLSFAPRAARRAGPAFRLLFGPEREAVAPGLDAGEVFGWAVLYLRHALVGLERGRPWHAEHCLGAALHRALGLACLARGLPAAHAKGADGLPAEVLAAAAEARPRAVEPNELRRALARTAAFLLAESPGLGAPSVRRRLEELAAG